MGGVHARLSPSNHRWPHCPGSVLAEAPYPDIPGAAAIDGTGSHLLLELCLVNKVSAVDYDQQIIGANHEEQPNGWLVNVDRIKRVQMCLDYVARRVDELDREYPGCHINIEAESKSNPGKVFGRTDWYGTCDITITVTEDMGADGMLVVFLETVDYKDGRSWVNVKDNTQLLSYLSGKLHEYCDLKVVENRPGCRMTIVQPKSSTPVRYQCSTRYEDGFSVETVLKSAAELNVAANKTDMPDPPRISGKHCEWCKASPKRGGDCDAAVGKSIKTVKSMNTELQSIEGSMFEQMQSLVANPESFTVEQLSEIMSAKDALMAAFDACEAEIEKRVTTGTPVPGYAMRPGNSKRTWNCTEEELVKKLRARKLKLDEIYPKKIISPAQMEKLDQLTDAQKKKLTDELVSTVEGKVKLTKVAFEQVEKDVNTMFMGVDLVKPDEDTSDISFF